MKNSFNWRINVILALVIIIGATIIGRLFFLQIIDRKMYEAQALGQQTNFNDVTGDRGQIFCMSSKETKNNINTSEIKSLAINKENWTISVNPKDITDKLSFSDALSKGIDQTKEEILSKIENGASYVVIQKDISSTDFDKIKALKIRGLAYENVPKRYYPQGEMASQVLGFLGGQGSGQYGIEGYYDELLKGKVGIHQDKSGIGFLFSNSDQEISLDGSDIYLTIDYNIQFQAEELLKQEKIKNNIDSGQIIVIKPDTGRIVALANFPNFDPNQYSKEPNLVIFQNSVVQKLFEPGSIMKPFTMIAALNEGKITQDSTYVDTGVIQFKSDKIRNFANEVYGKQTMTQVLESSINTGAVYAEQQIPHKTFFDYIEKFGFTKKTGIDLQGEVYSRNESLKNGYDIEYATASFGQGVVLTPMQIATGFCAIANGGRMVKPYIVEKIVNGKDTVKTKIEVSEPIFSKQTASQINAMLVSVVDNGFNSVAKIPGYYFAGKTGTAQIPLENGRGYQPDKNTIQSFVAYGPAFNPQFLIMVKLDNPKVPKSSLSAVPVFKQLAQYIINYWQIPPDYDPSTKAENK